MTLATNKHAAAPPSETGNRGGLLEHALTYLRQGWSVVPVIPNEKRPFIKWKEFQSRLPSEDEARRWWSAYPKARIGLVLGEVSGVVVADVDPRNGGDSAAFLAAHPTELVSESGGGGIHAFYRIDHELREKDCVHLPGIDMQMEGHIVVLPPSLHVSGRPYSWLREGAAAPFPTSLLAPPPPPRAANRALAPSGALTADQAARVIDLVAPYWIEGERHKIALALAGALLKSGDATRDDTKAILTALEGERPKDLRDRLAAVDTTAERLAQGEDVEAWSGLQAYLPEATVTALRDLIAPATTVEITNDARGKLPFRRTSDLLANLPPEPPWLWEGLIAPGVLTLLAGIWKGGKSTLVFALLDAVRRAGPLFNLATTSTPVVYLTEEPVWTVDEKVNQWGLDDSILWLQHTETAEMKWATVVEEAVQAAKEAEAKLLIVDTLPQWAQLKGETENHSGEMLAAVRPLQIAAQKHGLAVLILTHHRKSEGDYGTRIRGSGALPGAVDIILELERPKKREEDREGYRIVRTESRFKATPPELLIKLNPEGYVLVNDVRPADLASQAAITRQRILDAIAVRGTATVQQIIADTRLSRTTVYEHIKVLEEFEGKLEKASQAKPQAYRLRSTASVEISDQPDTTNTPSLSDSIAEAANSKDADANVLDSMTPWLEMPQ